MYVDVVNAVARSLAIAGAAIIFAGGAMAVIQILQKVLRDAPLKYSVIRRGFTSKIMLGLEFFVANDLIKSVLEPSLNQVLILAVIVAIRTVVGYSLNRELKELGPDD
jgi:uncharacterized membrane protein